MSKKKDFTISPKKRRRIVKLTRQTSDEDIAVFNKLAMRKYRKFITDLSKVVIQRREKLGMTAYNLSQRIGIHFNTLYKFESEGKIGADTLFQVCTYLDIDITFDTTRMTGERKYVILKEEMKAIKTSSPETQEVVSQE